MSMHRHTSMCLGNRQEVVFIIWHFEAAYSRAQNRTTTQPFSVHGGIEAAESRLAKKQKCIPKDDGFRRASSHGLHVGSHSIVWDTCSSCLSPAPPKP